MEPKTYTNVGSQRPRTAHTQRTLHTQCSLCPLPLLTPLKRLWFDPCRRHLLNIATSELTLTRHRRRWLNRLLNLGRSSLYPLYAWPPALMAAQRLENLSAEISLQNNSATSPSPLDKVLVATLAASSAEPLGLPSYAALRGLLQE